MLKFKKTYMLKYLSATVTVLYSAGSFAVPPSVTLPKSINLGVTSFYDGLTGDPGLTYQVYMKREHSTSLKDNQGNKAAPFNRSGLDVNILINQLDYKFEQTEYGGNFGIGAILPIIGFSSDFGTGGPRLTDNGTKIGDVTLTSYYQFPLKFSGRAPVFSHRLGMDVMLPTGGYNQEKDINQSINATTIMPNWAFTFFLSERWEVSGRLNYMYNFKNSSPSGSVPIDFKGGPVNSIQAGQAAWLNFAGSYKVSPGFNIGVNGYYLKQITDDKVNGERFSGSKEQVFAIGPGMFWMTPDKKKSVWLNVYSESQVKNRFENKYTAQLRYIHQF